MTKRKTKFAIDRPRRSGLLATYFPINDPIVPIDLLCAYDAARVDVVELGIKTADPHADGAIIAASMRRAVGLGTVTEAHAAIQAVRAFEHDTMSMIFGYAEPKLAPDPDVWHHVDALLVLGAQDRTTDAITQAAAARGTRITRFVPYEMPQASLTAATTATGFVFLQYTAGKTGLRTKIDPDLATRIACLRDAGVTVPILTGIGISTAEQADHAMQSDADGIVVGSMAVQRAIAGRAALEDYLCELREVLDG